MSDPGIQPHSNDPERDRIVAEEEDTLRRVDANLKVQVARTPRADASNYDERLLDLRDQISQARAEDLPPLVQEMERLQLLANRLREVEEV